MIAVSTLVEGHFRSHILHICYIRYFIFSAMTMKSVGRAANAMVAECMRQFPDIVSGKAQPQYRRCVEISTRSSLFEMIPPGLLVILSPLAVAAALGKNGVGGMLIGTIRVRL